ncbi:MAG: DUF4190 domain-containing protein [Verrucomicrobiota bacterium]
MKWTYAEKSGLQHAVEESELPALVASGCITEDTLVWNETMSDWRPCGEVRPDLFNSSPTPPALTPSERTQVRALSAHTPGAPPSLDGLALSSMIFGILGLVSCLLILSIPAVICGHMGLKKANAEPGHPSNKAFSITGIVTGYLGICLLALIVLYFVLIAVIGISVGMEGFEEIESLDGP